MKSTKMTQKVLTPDKKLQMVNKLMKQIVKYDLCRIIFYKLMAKYKKSKKYENLQRRTRKTKEIPAGVL